MSTPGKPDFRPSQPVLPLAILAKGRECLVVGAGRTGCRKVLALLDACARVTVVAPRAAHSLYPLIDSGQVKWHQRAFEQRDLDGIFLVFAATDDARTNSMVLAASRRRGVLCGIVDNGWQDGDFISPAVVRRDDLTFAVSTGGKSCRRSRMVKENLGRHLEAVRTADLLVLGTSHEFLSLERRETLQLNAGRAEMVGQMLGQIWGLHEFALVNTCNRIELHAVVSDQPEAELLMRRILGFDCLGEHECYCLRGAAALRHTSVLLAGLLSQTPGETHIVAQVKDAFGAAGEAGWADSMMKEWLSSSLHIAKDIRRTVGPLLKGSGIEDLCLDYLAAREDEPLRDGLVVLGTGAIGRGVVERSLHRYPGLMVMWGYYRNSPQTPAGWGDRVCLAPFDSMREVLESSHAVVCAVSSPGHILGAENALWLERDKDIHIVDLGVPRNVDPAIAAGRPHIHVADLDDLKHWYRREAADLAEVMLVADRIIREHEDMYLKLVCGLRDVQ
jgi:glutamyl-tRNA reductase